MQLEARVRMRTTGSVGKGSVSTIPLVLACALDFLAGFLAFVVYDRASPAYFAAGVFVTLGLLAIGLLMSRVSLYVLAATFLVGAVSQLPQPDGGGLLILVTELSAAVLVASYLRGSRKTGKRSSDRSDA
jgi:hypothetical protein